MNMKLKQKLVVASMSVGITALMSLSPAAMAAPFEVDQAFTLTIAAPVIVPTVVTGLNFGASYLAVPGDASGNPSTIISTAGALTPTIGAAATGLLMAVSTTGKAALSYTATGGAPSAIMTLTLDDSTGAVGAGNTTVTLTDGTPAHGTFTLDTFTIATTVGAVAGFAPGANGTTGTATLSNTGALSAKFGATLTMVNDGTYVDGAYAGTIRVALDY